MKSKNSSQVYISQDVVAITIRYVTFSTDLGFLGVPFQKNNGSKRICIHWTLQIRKQYEKVVGPVG